ncbi:c-type cytochrome [Pseudogulbenkiania subflava]|uniref:Cytochrome c55X n=1 Tax=Pseudogulbenkiania subflava DSM 22618 TaxID=1123014 RepID=A0A1Y6BYQ2_9NEIS|nr:cytochrome c [Pseudogulbenkiania subflava]SMF27032.1 cytochrome c55X [Pseudogulbenkiania subflava DSM 22618]
MGTQPVRHVLAGLALLVSANLAMAAAPVSAPSPSPERAAVIRHLVRQDCGSCHGLTLKGGLGSPLTAEALASRSDEALLATILNGRPGTAMPPWRPFLTEEEAKWVIQWLRNGAPE